VLLLVTPSSLFTVRPRPRLDAATPALHGRARRRGRGPSPLSLLLSLCPGAVLTGAITAVVGKAVLGER
jgi:hypothetical protein